MYIYLFILVFFKICFPFSEIKQAFPVSFSVIIMGHHTAARFGGAAKKRRTFQTRQVGARKPA